MNKKDIEDAFREAVEDFGHCKRQCAIMRDALTIISHDNMPWREDLRRFAMPKEIAGDAIKRCRGE